MHFEDAWSRYLLRGTPSGRSYSENQSSEQGHQSGNSSDTSGTTPENDARSNGYGVSDDGSDGSACRMQSDTEQASDAIDNTTVSDGIRHERPSDTSGGTAESERFHSVNDAVSDVSDELASDAPSSNENIPKGAQRRSRPGSNGGDTQEGGEEK
jgi:hypothetical protein